MSMMYSSGLVVPMSLGHRLAPFRLGADHTFPLAWRLTSFLLRCSCKLARFWLSEWRILTATLEGFCKFKCELTFEFADVLPG